MNEKYIIYSENKEEMYLLGSLAEKKLLNREGVLTSRGGRSQEGKDGKAEYFARNLFWQKGQVIAKRSSFLWEVFDVSDTSFIHVADLRFYNLVTDLKEDGSSYGSGTNTSKKIIIPQDFYERVDKDIIYICLVLDLLIGGKEELYFVCETLRDLLDETSRVSEVVSPSDGVLWFNIKKYLKMIGRV